MAKLAPVAVAIDQRLEKKWSPALIKAGYTVIPNAVLLRQQALGLDSIDVNIILIIASYWWDPGKPPFPSKQTISKAMGIHPSTVRRRIAALEKGGLLKRNRRKNKFGGNNTNTYDFGPLITSATPYANDMLADKAKHIKAKDDKLTKKGKPSLQTVK